MILNLTLQLLTEVQFKIKNHAKHDRAWVLVTLQNFTINKKLFLILNNEHSIINLYLNIGGIYESNYKNRLGT
jgi:hypothetical protein